MLLKGRSLEAASRYAPDPLVNFSFDVKSVTHMMATPDEISIALTDASQRLQWDNGITAVEKTGEDSIRLTYETCDGFTYQENVQISNFFDKADRSGNATHFIMEHVNGEFYRFFELQQVQNRPFNLRVTLYTHVTPTAFKVRGKDLYRSLNSLTQFLSQSNRVGQNAMVLKKSDYNGDEMVASLKPTGFDLIQEDDEQQQSVIDDDEEDAIDAEPKEPEQPRRNQEEVKRGA
jgi:hypothetical protein